MFVVYFNWANYITYYKGAKHNWSLIHWTFRWSRQKTLLKKTNGKWKNWKKNNIVRWKSWKKHTRVRWGMFVNVCIDGEMIMSSSAFILCAKIIRFIYTDTIRNNMKS